MFTTHNNRPATIYIEETVVYAVYDDGDEDVFFHADLDDESIDLEADLENEFGEVLAAEIIAEVRR